MVLMSGSVMSSCVGVERFRVDLAFMGRAGARGGNSTHTQNSFPLLLTCVVLLLRRFGELWGSLETF